MSHCKKSIAESAYCDIGLRHSDEPFSAYGAIREKSLHFRVIQQAEAGLKILHLIPRRFPFQTVVREISDKPVPPQEKRKPVDEWRKVVRLQEEAACRSLAVNALANAA